MSVQKRSAHSVQSVVYNRQSIARLHEEQLKLQPKKKPCACLTGCFQGLAEHLKGGLRQADGGGDASAPQPLEPLAEARPWSELSEQERGGVKVACLSAVKEDEQGWTNQDSYLACVPVSGSKADAGSGEHPGGGPWESYDAYGDPSAPAESQEAAQPVRHALFGVLDGHGRCGHDVSRLAASRIAGHLGADASLRRDASKALSKAVVKADDDVYKQLAGDVEYNGTTAVVVCMDLLHRVLHCANVGDSRAVIGRLNQDSAWQAVPLTEDIKPDMPAEKERIEMHGGVVAPARIHGEYIGPQRVWEDWGLKKPGLAMGRSIGDGCARRVGIIPEPVMSSHKLRPDDRFAIIASDGLWDALSNHDAVSLAARHIESPETAVSKLVELTRVRQEGSLEDDTTIVMLVFEP